MCNRAYLNAVIQSSMFVGMMVGAFISGMLSDAFGRKTCIFVFNGIMVSKDVSTFNCRIWTL